MKSADDRHEPTPEFVSGLEQSIVKAWRTEAATVAAVQAPTARRWELARMAAVLAIGLLGGFGAQFALAQVQSDRTREEVVRSLDVERLALEHRLAIARSELERVRAALAAGAVTDGEVRRAELEARAISAQMERMLLDWAEVQASRNPPRNELWAPLVGGRDYVTERLKVMAEVVREGVVAAEAEERLADQRVKIGAAGVWVLQAAQLKTMEEQARLQQLLAAIQLRDEAVARKLSSEEVTRRQQFVNMELELAAAGQRLTIARERLERMQAMAGSGAIPLIEVKRAELNLLEQELGLERITTELDRLRREAGNRLNWQFGKSGG